MSHTQNHESFRIASVVVAVAIFALMSYTFLFPCNKIIPLDRRTIAVVSALLCYLTRTFLFSEMNMLHAIDFDVLILLASIMVVNHIVIHLKETKKIIDYLQLLVKKHPVKGFWMISLAAFTVSPFLTNDGVCLLFVEPILNAFDLDSDHDEATHEDEASSNITNHHTLNPTNNNPEKLNRSDVIYFLLALACSANIGSQITYTGNPQNMLLSQDAISVMPSYKFFMYMLLPSGVVWLITIGWVYRCWNVSKQEQQLQQQQQQQQIEESENSPSLSLCEDDLDTGKATNNTANDAKMDENDIELAIFNEDTTKPKGEKLLLESSSSEKSETQSNKHLLSNTNSNKVPKSSNMPALNLSLCMCLPDDSSTTFSPLMTIPLSKPSSPASPVSFFGWGSASSKKNVLSPRTAAAMSPRRRRRRDREALMGKVVYVVTSPFPYMVLVLLAAMIVMIFVDVMPISALICVSAMAMVVSVVVGNHWRHQKVWGEHNHKRSHSHSRNHVEKNSELENNEVQHHVVSTGKITSSESIKNPVSYSLLATPTSSHNKGKDNSEGIPDEGELTSEEKMENLNEFFEQLFTSIDYSLLLIFLGTFIVVENMASTGIPKYFWNKIVGDRPFQSFSSVLGISLFVLISSQLLGNVAVVQLAIPNVEPLNPATKRFAWAIISFVATVGGNLTITGSAANIIVAEKASKLDPSLSIDFFRHYKVCFWITIVSCVVGSLIITAIISLDNLTGSNW